MLFLSIHFKLKIWRAERKAEKMEGSHSDADAQEIL